MRPLSFAAVRGRVTPTSPSPAVEEAILPIRDEPPAGWRRTPGPQTILYDLDKRAELKTAGHDLPRATSPLWRILDQPPRLDRSQRPKAVPAPPAAPMEKGPMNVKSVSRRPPEEDGKRPHGVDTLNGIDVGTSIWVEAGPRAEDQAETTLDHRGRYFHPIRMTGRPLFRPRPAFRGRLVDASISKGLQALSRRAGRATDGGPAAATPEKWFCRTRPSERAIGVPGAGTADGLRSHGSGDRGRQAA